MNYKNKINLLKIELAAEKKLVKLLEEYIVELNGLLDDLLK